MIAIIGGETRRFAPLVELYRKSFGSSQNSSNDMKVGIHSFGYVAENRQKAIDEFFPGYKRMFDRIGKERGWGGVTMDRFLFQNGPNGAYLVGDVEEVANKIVTHSMSLGGLSRFQFQIENELLTHEQIMNSIEMIGLEVKPRVLEILNDN
jgi:alkanesulfonate monooxygenase SsuD/methylene tetrahydromethanopterin reductase-like flavin-dependent oxidoreductase (luciferase family)